MRRIRKVNDQFFEQIDTPEKAYALGIIYSDGNIWKSKQWNSCVITIVQHERDKDILNKLLNAFESDIKLVARVINGITYYSIQIHSTEMANDLEKLGVSERKSLTLEFPNFIDDSLFGAFLLGYFDGDGSIWEGKRKKMTVKNEKKPGTTRERIVHNVKFNITGSEKFIIGLQNVLVEKYGFTRTKLNYKKAKEEHTHCTIEYSGRGNIKRLYEIMYKDMPIYGERKKKKFEKILAKND